MRHPLRIGLVAPVATAVPPAGSGSIETLTSALAEGLVARGHAVTLFATGSSSTAGTLHALYPRGYRDDPAMWPWEMYELFNLAAAVEHASAFDIVHSQAEYSPMSLAFSRLSPAPILQTIHHSPSQDEVTLFRRYSDAPFVAVSHAQARLLSGLNVVAVVHHGIDTTAFAFQPAPDDYLLFLGRFAERKGVLQSIEAARRMGIRLLLAAAENDYYHNTVAPLVDGKSVVYVGEVEGAAKVALLGGARALLYPIQEPEPFGLVLIEAMACGTPAAVLDCGAAGEIVQNGVTGGVFATLDAMVAGMPGVMALDRGRIRRGVVDQFSADRMVDGYLRVYERVVALRAGQTERTA